METLLSIIAGLAGLKFSFNFFFNDMGDLYECIKYWFTPNIISMFRREYEHDWWAELKLFIWALTGIIFGYATYQFLTPV